MSWRRCSRVAARRPPAPASSARSMSPESLNAICVESRGAQLQAVDAQRRRRGSSRSAPQPAHRLATGAVAPQPSPYVPRLLPCAP
jgi:hypothetical protein